MPLVVNLRHLETHNIRLEGKLPAKELDIDTHDEVIRVRLPLEHDLEVQKLEDGLLGFLLGAINGYMVIGTILRGDISKNLIGKFI